MEWTRRALLAAAGAGVVGAVLASRSTDPDSVIAGDELVAAAEPLPVLDPGPAPSLLVASGWLNSEPLGPDELRGSVVLYDFWTFGCVNCRHTLPALKGWHEAYADSGLVIASIHTPEFSYEAEPANVAEFVADEGIEYPVALDPDKEIWRAFDNHAWPVFYLYDRAGRRRYRHAGEGRYDTTEAAIVSLLEV